MASFIHDLTTGAARTAHAAYVSALCAKPQAKPGEKLPLEVHVKETEPGKPFALELTGKNIIVGVPGAFTPSCSSQAPAYIEKYEEFKAKGIREIFIVTVNDAYVTKAWKEKLAPDGTPVRFIADDQGVFVASLGLIFDATLGLGVPRSKRFVVITDGDKIEKVIVEENPSEVKVTAATSVLAQL
ncbi:Redoxin [Lactarius tabidus]